MVPRSIGYERFSGQSEPPIYKADRGVKGLGACYWDEQLGGYVFPLEDEFEGMGGLFSKIKKGLSRLWKKVKPIAIPAITMFGLPGGGNTVSSLFGHRFASNTIAGRFLSKGMVGAASGNLSSQMTNPLSQTRLAARGITNADMIADVRAGNVSIADASAISRSKLAMSAYTQAVPVSALSSQGALPTMVQGAPYQLQEVSATPDYIRDAQLRQGSFDAASRELTFNPMGEGNPAGYQLATPDPFGLKDPDMSLKVGESVVNKGNAGNLFSSIFSKTMEYMTMKSRLQAAGYTGGELDELMRLYAMGQLGNLFGGQQIAQGAVGPSGAPGGGGGGGGSSAGSSTGGSGGETIEGDGSDGEEKKGSNTAMIAAVVAAAAIGYIL